MKPKIDYESIKKLPDDRIITSRCKRCGVTFSGKKKDVVEKAKRHVLEHRDRDEMLDLLIEPGEYYGDFFGDEF